MPETEVSRDTVLVPAGTRPFPWFCPRCRRKEVWRSFAPYECERTYRGQVVTIQIPDLIVSKCANCGELVFDYFSEEQINKAFLAKVRMLEDDIEMPGEPACKAHNHPPGCQCGFGIKGASRKRANIKPRLGIATAAHDE